MSGGFAVDVGASPPSPRVGAAPADADSVISALAPCGGARVGNTVACCRGAVVVGPDFLCNGVAWALIFAISLAFLALVAPRLHVGVLVGNAATLAALVAAFAATSLADPGYLPRQTPEALAAQRAALAAGGGGASAPSKGGAAVVVSVLPGSGGASGGGGAGGGGGVDVAAASGFTACSI